MIFKFFNYLVNNNIDYCILNGYDDIHSRAVTDSDIDILVRKKDFKIIEDIINLFCDQEGFILVQIYHQGLFAKNIFLFNKDSNELLNLDLYAEINVEEMSIYSEDNLFTDIEYFQKIPILSGPHEFLYYLIKKLVKNDLTEESYDHLRRLYVNNIEKCDKGLDAAFPKNNGIVKKSFNKNHLNLLINSIDPVRREIYPHKKHHIVNIIKNSRRIIKRIFKPTGLVIAFLGPDGSGKSTIIDALKKEQLPFRRIDYFHLKPIKKDENNVIHVVNPHEFDPYSKLKSYIKLIYFIFQYQLGWLKNIRGLKIRSSLIIFDRYYDDLYVDYRRYRFGGNLKTAKMIGLFIPKPDIYFVLIGDKEVIYNRKKEVTIEELERQLAGYENLIDGEHFFRLNVNKPPQEILKEVKSIIMNKMNERY